MPLDRNSELLLGVLTVSLIGYAVASSIERQRRRWWVRPWLRRRHEGRDMLAMVEDEMKHEDKENYKNFIRMDEENFLKVLSFIRHKITYRDTKLRQCITAEKRLLIIL